MSEFVGLDGKPISSKKEEIEYEINEIKVKTSDLPKELLGEALSKAREMFAQSIMMQAMQGGKSQGEAQTIAMAEASKIMTPFVLEPCAKAVFIATSKSFEDLKKKTEELESKIMSLENEISEIKGDKV